jgi:hypothetical protein
MPIFCLLKISRSCLFITLIWSNLFAKVDFTNDVRPILSEHCFHCHGPDKSTREANLRLDLSEGALKDLGGYSAVVPGKPEDSELVFRLHSDDKDELMPPPETGKRLSPKQKKILEDWIKQGAEYENIGLFFRLPSPRSLLRLTRPNRPTRSIVS